MKKLHLLGVVYAFSLALTSNVTNAAIAYDANVTPDIIFGTGNSNGFWTVDTNNGIELGLRAKVRFANTYNSNADGTYNFDPGISSGTAALWNYEFAANVNVDGTSGFDLTSLSLLISIDTDPTAATSFTVLNILSTWADTAVGTNSTSNGGGTALSSLTIADLVNYNVAQNSQNLGFGNPPFFDANSDATWDFKLTALDGGENILAETSMQVIVGTGNPVPIPAAIWLFGSGLLGLVGIARRKVA